MVLEFIIIIIVIISIIIIIIIITIIIIIIYFFFPGYLYRLRWLKVYFSFKIFSITR